MMSIKAFLEVIEGVENKFKVEEAKEEI